MGKHLTCSRTLCEVVVRFRNENAWHVSSASSIDECDSSEGVGAGDGARGWSVWFTRKEFNESEIKGNALLVSHVLFLDRSDSSGSRPPLLTFGWSLLVIRVDTCSLLIQRLSCKDASENRPPMLMFVRLSTQRVAFEFLQWFPKDPFKDTSESKPPMLKLVKPSSHEKNVGPDPSLILFSWLNKTSQDY